MAEIFGSTLMALYHRDFGVTLDTGKVSKWANIAPLTLTTHDLAQGTADDRPVVGTSVGPKPSDEIQHDGVDDLLITPIDFVLATGDFISMIMVGKFDTTTTTGGDSDRMVSMGLHNGTISAWLRHGIIGLDQKWQIGHKLDAAGGFANITPDLDYHRFEINIVSTGSHVMVDNTLTAVTGSSGVESAANGTSRLATGVNIQTVAETYSGFGETNLKFLMFIKGDSSAQQLSDMRAWITREFGLP